MPQGKVIAVKPLGALTEEDSFTTESTSSIQDDSSREAWGGEVKILDGDHEGEIGSFKQKGDFGGTTEGTIVNLWIEETRNGKLKVKIVD